MRLGLWSSWQLPGVARARAWGAGWKQGFGATKYAGMRQAGGRTFSLQHSDYFRRRARAANSVENDEHGESELEVS